MASIYDKSLMNASDLKRIEELSKQWHATQDKQKRAKIHDSAEQIRNGYGYSGGGDGGSYEQIDGGLSAAASAARAYENALREAENERQRGYASDIAAAEELLARRLKEAYTGRLQNTLGLDQQLRASGITGGMSETIRAGYDNAYLKDREQAYSDAQDSKDRIKSEASKSAFETGEKIAKQDYDSALDRADRITAADKERYAREADAADRDLAERRFEYERQRDASELDYKKSRDADELDYKKARDAESTELALQKFEYQKEQDRLNREYQAKQDELERAYKQQTLAASASKRSSSSSEDKTRSDLVSSAWKLLQNGVYDDSMPEILGYSADVLKEYAESVKYDY